MPDINISKGDFFMRKFRKVLLMALMVCSLYGVTACGNANGDETNINNETTDNNNNTTNDNKDKNNNNKNNTDGNDNNMNNDKIMVVL